MRLIVHELTLLWMCCPAFGNTGSKAAENHQKLGPLSFAFRYGDYFGGQRGNKILETKL
jgi:hypothetical protein